MRSSILTAVMLCTCVFQFPQLRADDDTRGDQSALGNRVAEFLEMGFDRSAKASADSERLYRSLKIEAPQDPRIDFAHGLVLWKQMKNKEAQAEFLAATQSPGEPYRPAWKALIWTCFVSRSDEVGYARLLEFAKLVASSNTPSEPVSDPDAVWIGTVMAALELTVETKQRRESWIQAESKLTDILGKGLVELYLNGKADVHARHSLLENDIQQAREKAKQQRAEQLERKQNRLKKSQEDVKDKRENLKKSAAELKEAFEEKVAEHQRRIERLEKDYELAERRSSTLITSLAIIEQQLSVLQNRGRNQDTDRTIGQIQNQRIAINAEFMRTLAATQQIASSAQMLNQSQAEIVDQYQKATGEIVAEDDSTEKWKERTVKQAVALKRLEANVKPAVPKGKIQFARSFRTYVDLDVNVERAILLDSFGSPVVKQ